MTSSSDRERLRPARPEPNPNALRLRYGEERKPRQLTSDEITLTIPRDRALYSVAHLVLGGLGIRLNLTIEHLEDLQLALESVLERSSEAGDVTIAIRLSDEEIETAIGPMRDGVRDELAATEGEDVGLRRILDALVDDVELAPGEGGDWVTLTKHVGEQST